MSENQHTKIIVAGGAKGADIDVFACVVAYAELLHLQGKEAVPVITGAFTSSITPSIIEWGAEYQTQYVPDGSENFVLVDISDPDHFPAFISHDKISEVYDHRHGHEERWNKYLHKGAHIEMVGSCGTIIWEQFKKRSKEKDISKTSAKLLLASIVSNNLVFKSPLTTERDRSAYAELSTITGLSDDWISEYFLEQERILLGNFERYVRADIKTFKISEGEFAIGQIEMWNADDLLNTKKAELRDIMARVEPTPWIVNILNISKGFNYVYSASSRGQEIFEQKLHCKFDGDIVKTDKLLMRKYLMKVLGK